MTLGGAFLKGPYEIVYLAPNPILSVLTMVLYLMRNFYIQGIAVSSQSIRSGELS